MAIWMSNLITTANHFLTFYSSAFLHVQCQSQLKTLYAEGITGCHMEFAAYNLLCVILHSNNNRDLVSAMSRFATMTGFILVCCGLFMPAVYVLISWYSSPLEIPFCFGVTSCMTPVYFGAEILRNILNGLSLIEAFPKREQNIGKRSSNSSLKKRSRCSKKNEVFHYCWTSHTSLHKFTDLFVIKFSLKFANDYLVSKPEGHQSDRN